jgi:hypothetical protein
MEKPKTKHLSFQDWIDVKHRHGLSDSQVQMARELRLHAHKLPRTFHPNQRHERTLGELIEELYFKRHRRRHPMHVEDLEERVRQRRVRRNAKATAKRLARFTQRTAAPASTDERD